MNTANVVTLDASSRRRSRTHVGCPQCRRSVEIAEARFLALYAHPECAPKIYARQEPISLLERFVGISIAAYVAILVGGVLALLTVQAIVGG
jgi:hypothetical protein